MSREYSENVLVQNSAGNLLQNVLGWEVVMAYNSEKLGPDGKQTQPGAVLHCARRVGWFNYRASTAVLVRSAL